MRRPSAPAVVSTAGAVIAAAVALRSGRFGRRALLRAGLSSAAAALVARPRVPGSLAGAAIGSAVELPVMALPLAPAAIAAIRRSGDLRALAAGALVALATTRVWPTAPRTVEALRQHGTKRDVTPSADGGGAIIVVNPSARTASDELVAQLREELPAAEIVVAGEDDDLLALLVDAGARATAVLGAAGGDGTISAAAAIAHERGLTLLAIPGGTLNHFTRDLGVLTVDDSLEALRAGQAVAVDLADVAGNAFVNTCSIGAYTDLVAAREAIQDRIGKWPALVIALARVLSRAEPVELVIDGRHRRLWLGFVGNCHYEPPGFAPTWREVLDDGDLDVRLVDASRPLARTRLVVSVLTGRLGSSAVYEQRRVKELTMDSSAPFTLATDGELIEVEPTVTIRKREPTLEVFAPHR